MPVLTAIDAAAVRRWCTVALRELGAAREELNALNVYPVPDGDTGTNLLLTMESAARAVEETAGGRLADVTRALSHGALMGARGNSGVILSQLLRGVGEVLAPLDAAGPADLALAYQRAVELGYAAVAEPAEGTILTVARAAADAVTERREAALIDVIEAACTAAAAALERTPELLPALARAGVVDAGGRGLCVVLDALLSVVAGEPRHVSKPQPVAGRATSALVVAREAGSTEFAYEVQYLLEAPDDVVPALRDRLAPLGDSLVVVGGDGLYNVHVHVNDVGSAIEAGVEAGRPHRITVTRFDDQIGVTATPPATVTAPQRAIAGVTGGAPGRPGPDEVTRAVVTVAQGDGLLALFRDSGGIVVTGQAGAAPSTRELLDAITSSGAREVVLLPNDGNVLAAAQHAAAEARDAGHDVHVIPTKSPVQGLAALAVHDASRDFADDAIAMTTAASGTRFAEVTVAVRAAMTSAGPCAAGDVLGLIDGDVVVIGREVPDVAMDVVERMLVSGGELVTIVTGAGCPAGLGDTLAERVRAEHPLVEAEHYDGGQPHYPVLVGVE